MMILNIFEKTLQRGTLDVAAGESAVIVESGQERPTEVALALNVCFGCLPLSLERIEFLVEPFFGRLSGVDGAPHRAALFRNIDHCGAPRVQRRGVHSNECR